MSLHLKMVVVGLICFIPVVFGCFFGGQSRVKPPGIDSAAAGSDAMSAYDTDGNGEIGGAELDKTPALKAAIEEVDSDANGSISAQEITDRIEAWKESKVGLMTLSCIVQMNESPLEGATVKFIPESFLGSELQAGEGVTDQYGTASMSVKEPPEAGLSGMAPGFYRVEITHPSTTISTKYNTETIFGQEVANDANGMQEGIYFKMSSK